MEMRSPTSLCFTVNKTPEALKTKVLDNFVPMDGLVRVVVATTALGMGVNIPNVERVCHFGIPDTVEENVQEIGRAGRDGRKSHGILYFKSYHLAHCDDSMKAFIKNPETKCRREIWWRCTLKQSMQKFPHYMTVVTCVLKSVIVPCHRTKKVLTWPNLL